MSRRKNDPLRPLTADEQEALTQSSRSQAAPAAQVVRAKMLLAVAAGSDYQQAARAVGRKSGDAVASLSPSSILRRSRAASLSAAVTSDARQA